MNIQKIKSDFPIFKRLINKKPIIYLDSTASSLKPKEVIDAISAYYTEYSVNIFIATHLNLNFFFHKLVALYKNHSKSSLVNPFRT